MAKNEEWGESFQDVSPTCPHCGDEITDSPFEDMTAPDGSVIETDCGSCGEPVEVLIGVAVTWKARKAVRP